MNDEQLITSLRGLDRPVVPDPAFGRRLYDDLRLRRTPSPAPRAQLLLVAALIAVGTVAGALAVGSGAFQPQRVVTDATTPVPAPSDRRYQVEIPDGVTPKSSPDDVERAITQRGALRAPFSVSGIQAMRWFPGGEVPIFSGSISSGVPVWTVLIIGGDGRRLEMLVEDGTLAFAGSAEDSEGSGVETTAPAIPQATRDPSVPLRFEAPTGRTITPTLIGSPDDVPLPLFAKLVPAGDVIWSLARHRLYRIDARTNGITTVELPIGTWTQLEAGPIGLWVGGIDGRLLAVDPESGDVIRSLDAKGTNGLLGEDEEGLWLRDVGGIQLRDPETGKLIRRIETTENQGTASYVGIWRMPAFGSLWDVDRGSGDVHRIDPRTGEIVATIPVGADGTCGHDDPEPLRGIAEMPALMSACRGTVLIDPATNEVVKRFEEPRRGFVANGAWWSFQSPGLVAFDPTSDMDLEEFRLNDERTAAFAPVVAGDTLWFVVGERGGESKSFSRNTALARVPLSELPD